MTQQKSEDRIVPEGPRKRSPTREDEQLGGGKAVSVNQQAQQLLLNFATAENFAEPSAKVARGEAVDRFTVVPIAAPKAKSKGGRAVSATLEEVVKRLREAFECVASNKGAPGPDRQSINEVRKHLGEILEGLAADLISGHYQPGMIRRVCIPKPGGGERGLGIPNVVDRVVQEAIRGVLEPLYEPIFHESSHGFRPGRSCHTAIAEAQEHLSDGRKWVVDIDLSKFFDRVCHQRLMARLAQRVKDRRLLVIIGRLLKAKVVLPNGVTVNTEEGVPQGGPLSPLLSNIVLDELDWELDRRGHRFVRYADDCNIYVGSERAGQRVMKSLSKFIEGRLRLKVNLEKSAVAHPRDRHFLGFRLCPSSRDKGKVEVGLSARTKKRAADRVRELTPRNWGGSLKSCIARINRFLRGWIGFFGICSAREERTLRNMDAHIRRRLRAIQLKHWKRKRTIARKLISLGVKSKTAWRRVYDGRKSLWALSLDYVAHRGLRNAYFADQGLLSVRDLWKAKLRTADAPGQLNFAWG